MKLIRRATGILPEDVLVRLRDTVSEATCPARTNVESSYYSTFWYDLETAPRNVVERIIRGILRTHVPDSVRADLVGIEWWLGRLDAPFGTNFKFGVHRDFGQNPATGGFDSPLMSSVFFLTTLDDGALMVFQDVPDIESAEWDHQFPTANTFAMFRGPLWHTVVNRSDFLDTPSTVVPGDLRLTITINWWHFRPSSDAGAPMKLVAADYTGEIYPELVSELADYDPALLAHAG